MQLLNKKLRYIHVHVQVISLEPSMSNARMFTGGEVLVRGYWTF